VPDSLPPGWYHDPFGGPAARYWDGEQWDSAPPMLTADLVHDLPPERLQEKRRWIVPVLVGLVGLLGGMVIMLMWPRSETPTAAPLSTPPTPLPTTTASATTSASPQAKAVGDLVRDSMQRKFDSDPDVSTLRLKVIKVDLVNKNGNEYKGIATIHAGNGATEDVSVEVTADGDRVLWETPPGALVFAIPSPAPTTGVVPGADSHGFFGGPRCIDVAKLIIRTANSGVVICPVDGSPGDYSYRGLRLSDDSRIVLPAIRMPAGGFSATNSDGTRYDVTSQGLSIFTPDGEIYREPATAVGP